MKEDDKKELEETLNKFQELENKFDIQKEMKNIPLKYKKKVPFKEQLDIHKGKIYFLGFLSFVGIALGAMLIGGLIRGKNEFSLFEELKKSEDFLNSVLIVITYLSLLVCLFVSSYYLLYSIYYFRLEGMENTELWNKVKDGKKTKSQIFSIWFVLFFFLFHKSIFLFINNIPDDIWNGWPFIIFLLFSAFVGYFILKKDE